MFWLVFVASAAVSWGITGIVRRYATAGQVLDHPNARSAHSTPKPRGGGLAIVVVTSVAVAVLTAIGLVDVPLAAALLGGGILVAAVGFFDDRRSLPVRLRILAHCVAAAGAVYALGGLPPIRVGEVVVQTGAVGYVLATLGIVWSLNLFNFMDGIDGIAGSEGVFVAAAGSLLALVAGASAGSVLLGIVFAASCAGFLAWNWPPAKIFMGDVGSGFVGFVLVMLALADARGNPVALLVWVILGGVFFVDATVTLARRLLRGQRVHEAHNSHAYQRLARRWKSHRRVTSGVWLLNVLWLLPCAFVAVRYPSQAARMVVVALVPLVVLTLLLGAGHSESPTEHGPTSARRRGS